MMVVEICQSSDLTKSIYTISQCVGRRFISVSVYGKYKLLVRAKTKYRKENLQTCKLVKKDKVIL